MKGDRYTLTPGLVPRALSPTSADIELEEVTRASLRTAEEEMEARESRTEDDVDFPTGPSRAGSFGAGPSGAGSSGAGPSGASPFGVDLSGADPSGKDTDVAVGPSDIGRGRGRVVPSRRVPDSFPARKPHLRSSRGSGRD